MAEWPRRVEGEIIESDRPGEHIFLFRQPIGGADGRHGLYEFTQTHVVYMQTSRRRASVHERDQLADAPLVGGVLRELLREPALLLPGLDIEQREQRGHVEERQPP
jgi:hypothetical protein